MNVTPTPAEQLTPAQRRVLAIEGVTRIGTDARNRPVIQAVGQVSAGGVRRTWAVKRDGDPTDPAEPIEPAPAVLADRADRADTAAVYDPRHPDLQARLAATRADRAAKAAAPEPIGADLADALTMVIHAARVMAAAYSDRRHIAAAADMLEANRSRLLLSPGLPAADKEVPMPR
jgi:hypothetical protein